MHFLGISYTHMQMLGISSRRKKKKSTKPDKVSADVFCIPFPIPMAMASLGSGPPETLSKACVTWKSTVSQFLPQAARRLGNYGFVSARRVPSEGISAKLKLEISFGRNSQGNKENFSKFKIFIS